MQQTPPIISQIVRAGRVEVWTLPAIAALVKQGLTTEDYTALALTADEHHMTIAQLMRRALEVQQ